MFRRTQGITLNHLALVRRRPDRQMIGRLEGFPVCHSAPYTTNMTGHKALNSTEAPHTHTQHPCIFIDVILPPKPAGGKESR